MHCTRPTVLRIMAANLVLLFLLMAQGCVFLVPIVVAYLEDGETTVTVELPKSAPEVFEAARNQLQMETPPSGIPFTIKAMDPAKYRFELVGTDDTWHATFTIIPLSDTSCQILAQGSDLNRESDESERLILLGVKKLCDTLGVKYKVVGKK